MAKWLFDAGHGGNDPGACYKGRRECDDVLMLTKEVAKLMQSNGETVDFTRSSDATMSLTERTNKANANNYDYLVSFHRNAFKPEEAKGVETFVYIGYANRVDGQLASKVNAELVNVGFFNRKVKEANLHMVRESKCPAILIEVGFIDNSQDNALFDSKVNEIIKAIAKGCLAQVGKTISSSTPTPPPTSGEMYRIRLSWSDAGSQKGAYSVLENAITECKKHVGYSVYNSAGSVMFTNSPSQPTPPPAPPVTSTKKYLNLKPHNESWSVYNVNGPYTTKYAIGKLSPAQFGGLSYEILDEKGNDVYVIQTGSFGKVAIWVPKDNDSSFTTSPVYGGTSSSKQYLNLKPHNPTWSVYNVNGPYTTNYAVGKLAPAQFGGISYEILASKGNDVYVIQTGTFGKVAIWAPKDNDSSFTSYPVYQ